MYIFASNGSGIYNTSIKVIIQICIESNLRQRVVGNANPIKLGKCFQFLNDWYGFEHGAKSFQGNQHKKVSAKILHSPDLVNAPFTQKDLAQDYGISHQTMNNYMRLAKAIPELEDLVDTGIVTTHTALAIMRNLSEDSLKFIWVHTACT